jgi:hypothetical protein
LGTHQQHDAFWSPQAGADGDHPARLNTLYIAGGVTRLTCERSFTEGTLYLYGDGVLEIGADLNGSSAGDFSRWCGTSANQYYLTEGGGFSAYGADRTVIMNNTATWAVTWAQRFMVDGKPFVLSSPYADATLIFANPIDLNDRPRIPRPGRLGQHRRLSDEPDLRQPHVRAGQERRRQLELEVRRATAATCRSSAAACASARTAFSRAERTRWC